MSSTQLPIASVSLKDLAAFADVPMEMEVELDRRTVPIREVLSLEPGSVIVLSRAAGENVDVWMNGVLIGFGEIVVLEEKLGVRITDFEVA
ncbi:MAG: flagellar motor switch protein FliN [Bryobacterales bacterium]|nr:flagellar motor switch protein FliN [Bryobacterales bacterium]